MDLGALFMVLAVVLLVGIYVSRPFFEKTSGSTGVAADSMDSEEHQISTLMAERDRILTALQELDFDHQLRKIPEEDYPIQRAYLLQQGAQVLRQLDSYSAQAVTASAEDRLEAVVAARRADAAVRTNRGRTGVVVEDDLEEMISARRQAKAESSAGFCPSCGKTVQKSDRFCPKCGTTL